MVSLQWTLFGTSTGGLQQVYYTIQHKLPVILEAFQASSCLTMPNFAHVFLTSFSASIIDIGTWWNWICSLLKLTGLQKYGHNQQIYYLFAGLVYLGNVGESGILKNKTKKQNNAESNCGARTIPQAPSHEGPSEKLYAPQLNSLMQSSNKSLGSLHFLHKALF